MPGGGVAPLAAPTSIERIEAPVTLKAYLMCAFASFGGIFFGYDSGEGRQHGPTAHDE